MPYQQQKLSIGLFGFGVVGSGLYEVLKKTPSLSATIKKVCIKHPEKKRSAPKELFTTDANELLLDQEINLIVELIDDSTAAFEIVSFALQNNKAVVSANKKMIAEHFKTLLELQDKYKQPFLYESACCASIPIIRNLEEYYDNDLLQRVTGIVNGSTNYILTKMTQSNLSFTAALQLAQEQGFAESNPTLDVNGFDALNKLCILLVHAYGIVAKPAEIIFNGLQNLQSRDFKFANEKNYIIKLIANAQKLEDRTVASYALPQFVRRDEVLASVNFENNGLIIESSLSDKQFFIGKGAGSYPTASAVLSDISALRYQYKYEYRKLNQDINNSTKLSTDFYLKVYCGCNKLQQIPHHIFKEVEEWSSTPSGSFVIGWIHISKLNNDWWKTEAISLILLPDPVQKFDEEKYILENELDSQYIV
jgi:homoserine dehydrogenase